MKLALAAGVLALAGAAPQATVLGWDYGAKRITWYHAGTLTPAKGASASWNRSLCSWSYAPDGRRLALSDCNGTVRFVSVRTLKTTGHVAAGSVWDAAALSWVTPARLLAVNRGGGGNATLVVVDTASGRVVRSAPLGGALLGRAVAGERAVFLVAPSDSFGPARVVVADADGNLRTATLDGIVAGSHFAPGDDGSPNAEVRTPGFAVDPAGTAYVVDADLRVATVDLVTLRIAYHGATRALSKALNGTVRIAAWLGNGKVAVSGTDYATTGAGANLSVTSTPAGLQLVDTSRWTFTTLDPDAAGLLADGGTVLGTAQATWSAYDASGAHRYDLEMPKDTWASLARGYAYVCTERWLARVVDARTGVSVATPQAKTRGCPTVLAGRASTF